MRVHAWAIMPDREVSREFIALFVLSFLKEMGMQLGDILEFIEDLSK